ncbi:unnamed protein product, partial [Closterium sp. NIES-53]
VLGNAKGAVAVVVSIIIFRNPVTLLGMIGYGITVAGVVLYSEAKKRTMSSRKPERLPLALTLSTRRKLIHYY